MNEAQINQEDTMNEVQQSTKDLCIDLEENVRTGYQAAVNLWIAESSQIWTRFDVMLVANSIIVAAIGFVLTGQRPLPTLAISLRIVGLILCVVWFILMKRDFEYLSYLVLSARELEERYLDPIKTISRGGSFVKGKAVRLTISGVSVTRRMSRLACLLRDRTAAYIVILVFVILYIVMLFQT